VLTRLPLVALFLGALVGAAVGLHSTLSVMAGVTATAAAIAIAVTRRRPGGRAVGVVVAVVAAAAAAGALERETYLRIQAALPSEDDVVVIEGIVIDDVAAANGRRLMVEVAESEPTALVAVHILVQMPVGAGDHVRVRGRVRRPGPALSPGTFDAEVAARARAVHGVIRVFDVADVVAVAHDTAPPLVQVRDALRRRLMSHVSPRMAGLLLALLIGDVSLFDDEQNNAYRHVGAGHLLAVSGLQVTLLAVVLRRAATILLVLIPGVGRRRRAQVWAAVVALLGVWAFVGVCGMPPSAVRAAVMASAVVVGAAAGRRVLLVDAIAAAGLVTVLVSPSSVDDAGFLLSYAAVLALAATTPPTLTMPSSGSSGSPSPFYSLWQRARAPLIASLTAGFATVPISAWLFGQFAPAGLVANIVLVPIASALQLPALLCGVVGAVTDWWWVTWIGAQAALVLEAVVFGLADVLPGVRAVEPPSAMWSAAFSLAALLLGGLVIEGRTRAAVAVLGGIVLAAVVMRYEDRALRVTFLPVGQGDGIVVEFPDGGVMVVDGGGRVAFDRNASEVGRAEALEDPGSRTLLPFLARRGIDHVDVMVASHPHPDHVGGLRPVARSLPVGALWIAGDADTPGRLMGPLIDAVGRSRVHSTPALLGTHTMGGATVDVLAPAPVEGSATYPEFHANDNSLVIRVCFEGQCVLLPGDLESLGEEALLASVPPEKLRAVVVKAGHHGSDTSSTPAFVAATAAAHVVFCTGRHNTFGFPSPSVVERWAAAGAAQWDTAVQGEVRFAIRANGLTVRSHRR
jgi:competence protein ComEC